MEGGSEVSAKVQMKEVVKMDKKLVATPEGVSPPQGFLERVIEMIHAFRPLEFQNGAPLIALFDEKSGAYYVNCHLSGTHLASKTDLDAVLDPDDTDEYKLNRELIRDTYAYKAMERDARDGRRFEELVVEYDISYRPEKCLKVFGGQHRIQAIKQATKTKGDIHHGVRVYLGLSVSQRVEIATVNNTSIAVSADLLDRMREDLLGTELRSWCQQVGLLEKGADFADRRSAEGVPTVRIARTLVVNFHEGRNAKEDDYLVPVVCSSGQELDKNYSKVRGAIEWSDATLITMGKEFAGVHQTQREKILAKTQKRYIEFANKAIHP